MDEIVDEILDTTPVSEVGTWNGTRLEWCGPHGIISPLPVPPHDLLLPAILMAAKKFGCAAVAGHEDNSIGRPFVEDERWYAGATTPPNLTKFSQGDDGATVLSLEITAEPARWMWILGAFMFVSLAWILFLFIGGLKEMVQQFWRMAVTGSTQLLVISIYESTIRTEYSETGTDDQTSEISREGLLAFSHGTASTGANKLIAIYPDRILYLPALLDRRNKNEQEAHIELVAQLNLAIGTN